MVELPDNLKITTRARLFYEELCEGKYHIPYYHNKKYTAKKKQDLQLVLDLTCAWELYSILIDKQ